MKVLYIFLIFVGITTNLFATFNEKEEKSTFLDSHKVWIDFGLSKSNSRLLFDREDFVSRLSIIFKWIRNSYIVINMKMLMDIIVLKGEILTLFRFH